MKNLKQLELKERYKQALISRGEGGEMLDYYLKTAEYIVEVENGNSLIPIKKSSIQKDFYYPDDSKGIGETEQEKKEYFINENLQSINKIIDDLESLGNFKKAYMNDNNSNIIKCFAVLKDWQIEEENKFTLLSDAEVQSLIDGHKIVKLNFEKRLQTYLKKYGISKLNICSYWRDR